MRKQGVDASRHVGRADRVLQLVEVIVGRVDGVDLQLLGGFPAKPSVKVVGGVGKGEQDRQQKEPL